MKNDTQTKTGFIAILGKPNVGKSSILNAMLGQKVSIVSAKPQTTQTRIMGILTEGATQLVFVDTPGVHKPINTLGHHMIKAANDSVADTDIGLFVVEANKKINFEEITLLEKFRDNKSKVVLAINKIDLVKNKALLAKQISSLSSLYNFEAIIPISAKSFDGIRDLIDELKKLSSPGIHFFDDDALTDQPERRLFEQIIREKILRLLDKEVPHGIAVCVEQIKNRSNGITDIHAVIYCEKSSHKGIIIGKQGTMLKKIGTYARQDIEKFFSLKINLQLWVKVKEDWRNKENLLMSFIYNNQ